MKVKWQLFNVSCILNFCLSAAIFINLHYLLIASKKGLSTTEDFLIYSLFLLGLLTNIFTGVIGTKIYNKRTTDQTYSKSFRAWIIIHFILAIVFEIATGLLVYSMFKDLIYNSRLHIEYKFLSLLIGIPGLFFASLPYLFLVWPLLSEIKKNYVSSNNPDEIGQLSY